MKTLVLAVCWITLGLALVDFAGFTADELPRLRAEESALADELKTALQRLRRSGPPPGEVEVAALRAAVAFARENGAVARRRFFRSAAKPSDYLFEETERTPRRTLGERRDRIEQALLELWLQIHDVPALGAVNTGLLFPSASIPVPTEEDALEDQAERVIATRWIAEGLDRVDSVELRRFRLTRAPDGRLELDMELDAGADQALDFFEHMTRPDSRISPRDIVYFEFARLEPEMWGPHLARFRSPPVRIALRLLLLNPSNCGAPSAALTSEREDGE